MTLHHIPIAYKEAASGNVLTQGLNFRQTLVYADDPVDTAWASEADNYPSQGIKDRLGNQDFNAGFMSGSPASRNRSQAVDPRLAGIVFFSARIPSTFRIDITGGVDWNFAFGDPAGVSALKLEVYDGEGGDLIVGYDLGNSAIPQLEWAAADGLIYNESAWVAADASRSSWRIGDEFSNYMWLEINFGFGASSSATAWANINVEYTP